MIAGHTLTVIDWDGQGARNRQHDIKRLYEACSMDVDEISILGVITYKRFFIAGAISLYSSRASFVGIKRRPSLLNSLSGKQEQNFFKERLMADGEQFI
jgi:hypothetical protein